MIWLECLVSLIPWRGGHAVLTTFLDVTERKTAEVQLRHLHDELEHRIEQRTADLQLANQQLQKEIAERKQREADLRESEERFRNLIEGSIQGILIHDSGRPIFANQSLADMFGYDAVDDILRLDTILTLFALQDWKRIQLNIKTQLNGDASQMSSTYQGRRQDGSLIWVENRVRVIPWDGRRCLQWILVDITERKRLEEGLRQSQKMEAMGTLASGIAHDFNNILGAITGFVDSIRSEATPDSTVGRDIQEVHTAIQRAKDLVQQILTFSRRTGQERKQTHLQKVVFEVLGLLRSSLPPMIRIESTLVPEAGAVFADSSQIHQVLMNLCANAEHAMRSTGGFLKIAMASVDAGTQLAALIPPLRPGTYVQLSVRDTGHGIAPDVLPHIFEPFFTTKNVREGTGMGLATVYDIMNEHSGAVTVESKLGEGTVFHLYFPQIEAPVEGWAAQLEAPLALVRGCILLVDDDPVLVRLGQHLIERLGYEVIAHESSQAALEAFEMSPDRFNLVIMDYTMPNMNGDVLARKIKRIRPEMPIVLCTGFSRTMHEERLRKLGMSALVMKPFQLAELAATIQHVLAKQSARSGRSGDST